MSNDDPAFGPRGYLPERAAKRARKIILREPMGIGWPTAAVIAALVLLVTAVVYGALANRAPSGSWVPVVSPPHDILVREALGEQAVLLLRRGETVLAFIAPETNVRFCIGNRRLEGDDGSVWNLNGRLVGGPGESLTPVPTREAGGELYVDPDNPLPAPPAQDAGETPECR